jgi:hypothetical protein
MTQHLHNKLVEGCYRCELGKDEVWTLEDYQDECDRLDGQLASASELGKRLAAALDKDRGRMTVEDHYEETSVLDAARARGWL